MASKEVVHSGYCIYYEDRNVYLGEDGVQYDIPCRECLYGYGNGYFRPELLADAVAYNRKVFNGNIYVVEVEISRKNVNNHNFMETNTYESFLEVFGKRSQKDLEESLARVRKREYELPLKGNTYMHCANKTWIKHCKRYLQETFYNKPKKEVKNA